MRRAPLPVAVVLLACVACDGSAGRSLRVDLEPILARLGSEDPAEREAATDRLIALGPDVVPAVTAATSTAPAPVRVGLVDVLVGLESAEATDALIRLAAADPAADVRADALSALAQTADLRGELVVEAALADPDERVRLAGVRACASLCRSPKAFVQLIETALRADLPLGLVARNVVGQLLRFEPDGERVRILRVTVEDRALPPLAPDADERPAVRLRAAILAGDVGRAAGAAVLRAGLADEGPLRSHVVYALGEVGGVAAVPGLVALVDAPVAPYAYDALRRIATRDVPEARDALAAWSGPRVDQPLQPPYAIF